LAWLDERAHSSTSEYDTGVGTGRKPGSRVVDGRVVDGRVVAPAEAANAT
jgi:hypothetical protein